MKVFNLGINFFNKVLNKIKKNFFKKIYFTPTNYLDLPQKNYLNENNYEIQENLIKKFEKCDKRTSFITCPDLIFILLKEFKSEQRFSFFDIGGENIDFYLELKKNFENVEYYVLNIEKINKIFFKLKNNYNYKNFHIIQDISEIKIKKFDFVNFGSSIGYIKNHEEYLEKIALKSKYVMFSGTIMYDTNNPNYNKKIIVKQINMFPTINYLFFFKKKYFFNKFFENNYKLVFERINYTDKINFSNFNRLFYSINYMDFLFKKK